MGKCLYITFKNLSNHFKVYYPLNYDDKEEDIKLSLVSAFLNRNKSL